MYGIGQRVVHPMHGAGVIENVTEELLYGIAALSGNPPVQAIQQELGIPHRTASDWTKKARAEGRLAGMSYIVGRQADG